MKYTVLNLPTMERINAKPKKAGVAVSLFSGMGGGSIGLKLAGYEVRYANEFIPIARKTYRKNARGTYCDGRDIRKVKPKDILEVIGCKPGEVDLLEMSPPCKVFSAAQARNREKNVGQVINYSENVKQRVDDLFFEGCRILKGIQPRAFIAENVKGLLAEANKSIFKEVYRALERCGYRVKAAVLNGTDFGVPQARERLIFIGIRKDLGIEPQFPDISEHKPVYVQDALPHVAKIKTGRKFVQAKSNFISTITAADSAISFTAQFSAGGFCETVDGTIRKFTIKELKLLSSVPQDFKLIGTFKQRWERLGRIHLPLQVYYLASTLRKQLKAAT